MQQHPPSLDTPDEGYFASFTDMLVGIIFIFIILLMIVANDFQAATESVTKVTQERDEARNEARDRQRDDARDKARDENRDSVRDEERDKARDDARDRERDASHDTIVLANALAQAKAFVDSQAHDDATPVPANDANALQEAKALSDAKAAEEAETKRLTTVQQNLFNDSRGKILQKIQQTLNMQGFAVTADVTQGTLTIPEPTLFESGQTGINFKGKQAIRTLADTLNTYLPCIAPTANPNRLGGCAGLDFTPNDGLDVIFVDDYPAIAGSREDKLLLAVQHIVSVFDELKIAQPYLDTELKNKSGIPVLNIKVNQARRDLKNQEYDNPAFKNSVVLRFIMRQPNQDDIIKLQNSQSK